MAFDKILVLFISAVLTVPAFADADPALPPVDKSAYNLFNPVPDDRLRVFSPDRPTKSSSASTVDAGHFQYEGDLTLWTYDRTNAAHVTISSFTVADPVLKAGLTANTDLELALAPMNSIQTHDRNADINNAAFGFGDVYARLKYNIIGNDSGSYALAIVPYAKAPTASAGIGNRHWEGGAYAPLTIPLPDNWGLNFQAEYDLLERNDLSGAYSNYQNLVNLSHPLIWDSLTGYIELWSDVSHDLGGQVEYTGDVSLAWVVRDNLQLDAGVNVGLNKAAPDLQSYAGISQRF